MNTKLKYFQDWTGLARRAGWSAEKMAGHCGVSGRTLCRHFLEHHGKTTSAWLVEQRLRRAGKLLRSGAPVKEVASRLGYRHANTFSREFKKFWGQSPTHLVLCPGQRPVSV